ncbi:hypothetical protein F5890DRAFT_1560717 [Lentinula detonsa]|uniref:Uncharacterized protein n=1 Tax=Lentinula detonsa TaxID=2804962 RepID=A0AA38PMD6_9AGAR|nr:hypothetical protein F5890DRAFT_1560717 [Lentinula detonsa]
MARAFLRSLYDFQSSFPSPFSHRRIPRSARRDIEWWSMFAVNWNGIHFIAPERAIIDVFTDASGTKGIGGILGSDWFSICTPRRSTWHS